MSGFVDIGLNPGKNDIAYENGKMIWAKGDDEVLQRVKTRLRRVYGEWFLYYTAGIPYFNGRMLGASDYDYVKLTLRNEIIRTKGVTDCNTMNLLIDRQTQKVSVYAEITVNANVYKLNEEL
jgi:hypothetical protein